MKKTVMTLALTLMIFSSVVKPVFAVNVPIFPSCLNPQGELIASYADGIHGIIGKGNTYIGSDKVYQLPNGAVAQCFCSAQGDGIQTNWFKATQLTEDEIKSLKLSGWIYVPSGTPWGLAEDPYMAQNIEFSCRATGGGQVNGTSSSSNGGSSSSSSNTGGSDLGSVLGLASTGNSEFIYNLWLFGLITLIIGVCLKKISLLKKRS